MPHAPLPVAVLGGGRPGLAEAARVAACPGLRLSAVIDPADDARERAAALGLPVAADVDEAPPETRAAVIATRAPGHGALVEACAARGWPVLIARPLADSLRDGRRVVAAAEAGGVPLMVGHHRRLDPRVIAARTALADGVLGRPVAVQSLWALRRAVPDPRVLWRVGSGGGAVLEMLAHEVDLLRHVMGDIAEVAAFVSHALRRGASEDTAAITLRFASGALGTALFTDAAVAPWGWDATPGGAAATPTGASTLRLLGDAGALSLPDMTLWRLGAATLAEDASSPSPLSLPAPETDTEAAQMTRFARVARAEAAPPCDGRDGLASLAAALAVIESARSGRAQRPDSETAPDRDRPDAAPAAPPPAT